MRNLKKLMLLCLGTCLTAATLTGCGFSFEKQWVWDSDSGKFEEVNYEEYGYDSSESAIKALWKGFAKCDEDKLSSCLISGDIAKSGYREDVDEFSDELLDAIMEIVEAAEDKGVVIDYKNLEITDTEDYDIDEDDDMEDLPDIFDIDGAELCTVIVPETQEVDGTVYEIEETYEMITVCIHDRWFITSFDCTNTEIVGD